MPHKLGRRNKSSSVGRGVQEERQEQESSQVWSTSWHIILASLGHENAYFIFLPLMSEHLNRKHIVCVCAATKWETLCQSLTARGSLINKLPDAELAQQEQQQQEQYKHCYVNAAALIKS